MFFKVLIFSEGKPIAYNLFCLQNRQNRVPYLKQIKIYIICAPPKKKYSYI